MAMLSVEEARERILSQATVMESEPVDLIHADGRTLAANLTAQRTQPPFNVSAMDGYAVRGSDVQTLPATLRIVGESAAGHRFDGEVCAGEAARIFTGAPVPLGADAIIIQENTSAEAGSVTVVEGRPDAGHIRKRGIDFSDGDVLVRSNTCLTPRDITLAAAMGHGSLPVRKKPKVAIVATGDELVLPGTPTGDDQIVCSNPFGIAAMVSRAGGEPEFLGIAPDDKQALSNICASAIGHDILVTIGGASVGDHDLVAPVLQDLGMSLDFWRIAMRPGKPLMFGRLDRTLVIGLPGNPVSSLICTRVFVLPLIRAMLGQASRDEQLEPGVAAEDIAANGPRKHYMRAVALRQQDGSLLVTPVSSQDSSLLGPLARADVLIVRPPHAGAVSQGEALQIMRLDF